MIKIKDELIELIQESTGLSLTESERKELVSFISSLKELLVYQKADDEIAQEFLLHMNVLYCVCEGSCRSPKSGGRWDSPPPYRPWTSPSPTTARIRI